MMKPHKQLVILVLVALVLTSVVSACASPTATLQPTAAPTKSAEAPVPTTAPAKPAVEFPTKDITLIVTYKAGGGFDIMARLLAPYLEKTLPKKVNVIVKNVAGAGGVVGSIELYDAKPDGHTISLLDAQSLTVAQVTGKLEKRDVRKMTWLGCVAEAPFTGVTNSGGNFKTAADIKGKTLKVAITALEVIPAPVLLKALGAANVKTTVFDSSVEAIEAVRRGDLDMVFTSFPTLWKSVQASEGKLIPVFVASDQRRPEVPGVPTVKELGVTLPPALLGSDRMLAAPPDLSPELFKLLDEAIQKATKDPAFIEQMTKAGYFPKVCSPSVAAENTAIVVKTFDENKAILAEAGQ